MFLKDLAASDFLDAALRSGRMALAPLGRAAGQLFTNFLTFAALIGVLFWSYEV